MHKRGNASVGMRLGAALVTLGLLLAACAPAAAPAPTEERPTIKPEAKSPAPTTKFTLRFAGASAPGSYSYVGIDKLKELVEIRSQGRIEVQKFEGNVGGETEILQRLQLGTFEGYIGSTGPLFALTKAGVLAALDLPYLFKDWDRYVQALNGPYGKQINEKVSAAGLRILAWGSLGDRILYQRFGPVNKPEDLKGRKIRVLENPVYIAWLRSIGAQPVAMAFPEVYTALQLGTIDGVDAALSSISAKHHEVAKHLTMTNHVIIGYPFIVSEKWFSSLPPDLQDVVAKAAVEAAAFEHDRDVKIQDDLLQQWKAGGVTVTNPDREAFRKSGEAVWSQFEQQIGKDLLDQLIKLNK